MNTQSPLIIEREVPNFVRLLQPCWVVGGAAAYMCGVTDTVPKDWDIIVERHRWGAMIERVFPTVKDMVMKVNPATSVTRFGGLRLCVEGVSYDMWPGEIGDYVQRAELPNLFAAVQMPSRLVLHGTPFRLETV